MNEIVVIYLMILSALAGIFALKCYGVIFKYFQKKRRLKVYPSIVKFEDSSLCKGPHEWTNTQLALSGLPIDHYKVCTKCGFIAGGSGFKLNGPGLEVLNNNVVRKERRAQRWAEAVAFKNSQVLKIRDELILCNVHKFSEDTSVNVNELKDFFQKSVMKIDDLYQSLNDKIDKDNNHG